MARPPLIKVPGRGQGRNIPKGYFLGRVAHGHGDIQLLDARHATQLGLATPGTLKAMASGGGGGGVGPGNPGNPLLFTPVTLAANVAIGQLIAINGTGVILADCSLGSTYMAEGCGQQVGLTGQTGYPLITMWGQEVLVSGPALPLTIGNLYYLGTSGNVAASPPTTAGYIIQEIGKAISTSSLIWKPQFLGQVGS